jgi:alpha-galactosidase
MMAWVTDSPTWVNNRALSLEYRFLSSMQGSLGIGSDLSKWTPQDFETAKRMVSLYKSVRETVQRGELYRLMEPTGDSEQSVTESVARDGHEAVLFAFLHSSTENYPYPIIFPQGLDPDAMYKIETFAGRLAKGTATEQSGAYWQQHGIDLAMRGDFQAAGVRLVRQK